jgi:signal transduction histidine kinase
VSARELRFLQTIAREIGPAICNAEFLGRLRSRVGAAERARIARDLHDGIIQSLIGLEMQVDVWRREAGVDPSAASKLGQIQNALRAEVLDLRDLIQRVKAVSIDPRHVLDHLASLVERFQRDSGITAHFVSEIDELTLSPQCCEEVARIVQEALVNVRKHSGARNVLVRVSATDGEWTFEVDDDGRGFEFAGRRSQAELDRERKGPVVIKERVRSIGGQLTVQSDPGRGARVEVRLPRRSDG